MTGTGAEPIVLVHRRGRVAVLTLNRPQARNALTAELIHALRAGLAAADQDDGVDAVVLTGSGTAFCAGLDLKEMASSGANLTAGTPRPGPEVNAPWAPISKPIIGAVNGPAITGGLELALHCDVLIGSPQAVFADTHARVGVLPGWGMSVLLPLAVGRGMARRMGLTGGPLSAAEALRVGLLTEIVDAAVLLDAAVAVAAAAAANNQDTVRAYLAAGRAVEQEQLGAGYAVEAGAALAWMAQAGWHNQEEHDDNN